VVYNPMSVVRFDSNRAGGAVAPIPLNDCLVNGSHPRIVNSTFDSNDAAVGGALFMPLNQCATIVLLINSTFTGNRAAYGSVYYGAGNTGVDMDGVHGGEQCCVSRRHHVPRAHGDVPLHAQRIRQQHCAGRRSGGRVVGDCGDFENSTVSNNVGDRGAVVRTRRRRVQGAHVQCRVQSNNVAKRANGGALEIVNALTIGNVSVIGCLFDERGGVRRRNVRVGLRPLNVTRVEFATTRRWRAARWALWSANVTLSRHASACKPRDWRRRRHDGRGRRIHRHARQRVRRQQSRVAMAA
jgi:hypothetical protein